MGRVAVVTDSTSDLPPEIVERLGISVVPLNLHFGDETFLDGELSSADFFARLSSSPQLPKTSAPSPDSFRSSFDAVLPDCSAVFCVTAGRKLSATYSAAALAARQFEKVPVRVLDSETTSLPLGFAAMAAAEAAGAGASLEDIEGAACDTLSRTTFLFYADTLEYLQRGGRIGRAAGLLGSLLQVKPVLTIAGGEVSPYHRARTARKATQLILDRTGKLGSIERLGVIWGNNEAELNRLLDGLAAFHPRDEIVVTEYSPVIGAHLGPGALGVIAVVGRSAT